MGYKALITLDLSAATEEQRKAFYEVLAENSWIKINSLTTTWKRTFSDFINRNDAERTLILDMELAKAKSKIAKVEYAFQMDNIKDITAGNI